MVYLMRKSCSVPKNFDMKDSKYKAVTCHVEGAAKIYDIKCPGDGDAKKLSGKYKELMDHDRCVTETAFIKGGDACSKASGVLLTNFGDNKEMVIGAKCDVTTVT
jgi:hypothetical protein